MHYSSEIVSSEFYKHLEMALTFTGILFTTIATLMLLRDMGFLLRDRLIVGAENDSPTLSEPQPKALAHIDSLAVVTEWNSFSNPDFHLMRKIMHQLIILDGRNLNSPRMLNEFGFQYSGIGRDPYNKQTTNRIMPAA